MNEDVKSENLRIHSRADELIACLEGEIAKRDEELAACRVAVENCEVFRARIVELESQYQRDVYGLNNEGDPIGGDPAGGYANDNARLRTELAAIKAQEPVAWVGTIEDGVPLLVVEPQNWKATPLYAAPVSEAKAQGVVMPERSNERNFTDLLTNYASGWNDCLDEVARLNASPVKQVSVPVGFRVMKPTSAVLRDGDRWEIYAPCGSGGIVHEDDVTDWVVRKLLDAISAALSAGKDSDQ